MNLNWTEKEGTGKARQRVEYECRRCHREVMAYPDGYLPIHRHKGKRARCDASGASTAFHKRK